MIGSKVKSLVEVLSAADVGRRLGWTNEEEVRIVEGFAWLPAGCADRAAVRDFVLTSDARPAGVPGRGAEDRKTTWVHALAASDRLEVALTNGWRLVVGLDVDFEKFVRLVQGLERA